MILLSFDIEEFDMPFEYDRSLPFEEQIAISVTGTQAILDILKRNNVTATFFCTANFAVHAAGMIKQIVQDGHEVASHGYYHSEFEAGHLKLSRDKLEEVSGQPVRGFRMPRMMPVDMNELHAAGYQYNSSLNPTFLPGRYNHLKSSRIWYYEGEVLQVPASVSPSFRIPLFWLSFHNLPLSLYKRLCRRSYSTDGYLNLYFHPWEFTDLGPKEKFGFPRYVTKYSGDKMKIRFDRLIQWMKTMNYPFGTFKMFMESEIHSGK